MLLDSTVFTVFPTVELDEVAKGVKEYLDHLVSHWTFLKTIFFENSIQTCAMTIFD